jgi:2-isopropylmalate synthase
MSLPSRVYYFDTTLRDGSQAEGISFSVEDKLRITEALDKLGINYVEGGWPGSNPKDMEYFKLAKDLKLNQAKVTAFGSTRYHKFKPEEDPNLLALIDAQTPVCCIFGKSWDFHVKEALKVSLEKNLEMIYDSIKFLKSKGREVVYDAEHFFDGYKNNPEYALKTLKSAIEGGADFICLADTNGGTLTSDLIKIIIEVKKNFPNIKLGIHAHNDSDLAVANSIAAVELGAEMVQGTINGYGERCGNANLCSIIPNIELKLGIKNLKPEQLKMLYEISHFVSELANLPHNNRLPYVGESAFAHKGGIHVSAVQKHPATYEHIEPELVGNKRRVLVSELAGKSNILFKMKELGIEIKDKEELPKKIVQEIKKLESEGFEFEGAEGSFELLIKKASGEYKPIFNLKNYRVIIEKEKENNLISEATIKIEINGKEVHTVAEGDGPVNALDNALRKALLDFYPELKDVFLSDYKVRVLGSHKGTASKVRVLIETRKDKNIWGTVGVSENIIEASWQALIDSIEYFIYKFIKK